MSLIKEEIESEIWRTIIKMRFLKHQNMLMYQNLLWSILVSLSLNLNFVINKTRRILFLIFLALQIWVKSFENLLMKIFNLPNMWIQSFSMRMEYQVYRIFLVTKVYLLTSMQTSNIKQMYIVRIIRLRISSSIAMTTIHSFTSIQMRLQTKKMLPIIITQP